jgi:hypothetical protein
MTAAGSVRRRWVRLTSRCSETDNPLHFLLDVSKTMGVGMTV